MLAMSRNIMEQFFRNVLFGIDYRLHLVFDRKSHYRVMTIGETIRKVQNEQLSLIRFGDGELVLIRGKSIPTQKSDQVLSKQLAKVLSTDETGLLIAVPDIFRGVSAYQKKSQHFWQEHLFFCRKIYCKYLNQSRLYGNAFFSRGYLTLRDHSECEKWFREIKKIWDEKAILLIEGATSYNGVGNDLFSKANKVQRVICKSKNCFVDYQIILKKAQEIKCDIILLSVGATSKPLALDLFHAGYRVIDIGNLNVEYIAFCNGLDSKEKMNKYWNQELAIKNNRAAYQEYRSQVIINLSLGE